MTRDISLTRSTLAYYAFPAFVLAVPTIPVYVYLPTFYAETLGLGLATTGVVLLVARLFDVFTDPLIGLASDRYRFRGSRRKPWIAVGAVIAAASLIALFQPPEEVSTTYLLVWAIGLYLGWTLVAVPYTAWGAELSADYHVRTRITGAREAAQIFGILIAGSLPAAVAGMGGTEPQGLAVVAWLAVLAGLPIVGLLLWRVPEPSAGDERTGHDGRGWRSITEIARNRPFLRLLTAWFVNGLANGIPAVLFPLYLQWGLEAGPVARGVLILAYFFAGVAAIPLWLWLSRRIGKHRAWCVAMIGACAAFIWVPFLSAGDIELFFLICVVTGMALGADLALPPALQADVVDLDTLRTRRRRAGLFFALWSMAYKLALACAVGIAFPALEALGFKPEPGNTPTALLALALIYAALPTLLKIGAIVLMWRHPITQRRHAIIRRRLDQRARETVRVWRTA